MVSGEHSMTIRALGSAALLLLLASGAVKAAIVHDTQGEFAAITINQGTTDTGGVVDPTRSIINNVFDGSTNTFFSIGLGGQVAFTITPGNQISSANAIEITFAAAVGHMEAVEVFLGTLADPYANSIGYLLNADANFFVNGTTGPGADDNSALADLSAAALAGTNGGVFAIANVAEGFDTISFRDASGLNNSGDGQNPYLLTGSTDGFDLDGVKVASIPVSEPATLALMGAGLLCLAAVNHNRRRAQPRHPLRS
jgi:hypothetical protein